MFAEPSFAIAGPEGFGVKSADGAFRFYLHWLLQTDYQAFLTDKPPGQITDSTFLVRFAGVQMDAIVAQRFHSQIFMDFSQSRLTLLDAWVEAQIARALIFKVGKFLYPISEERLTPGIALPFVSTSLATLLLPTRDTGLQLYGELIPGMLKYNLAVTNGATAGILGDADVDSAREVVGRVFARPLARTSVRALQKFGVGVGASYGNRVGTIANPELPILRTYGGQTFFAFKNDGTPAGTSLAKGGAWRVVPHMTWAYGPVAAYADWVHASNDIAGASIGSDAYSVIPSVVLTGEDAEPLSYIVPKHPFDLSKGHVGSFLLVGGVGRFEVDSSAFTSGAADPASAMRTATVYGGGFNWYPVRGIAVLSSFGHMVFESFAEAPARPNEDTLIVRVQMVL